MILSRMIGLHLMLSNDSAAIIVPLLPVTIYVCYNLTYRVSKKKQ